MCLLFVQRPKSEFSPLLRNHHLAIPILRVQPMHLELQVVSPYYFEVHAGSTKKHPSDYIFLENGNNLHDVLRACTNATLDMVQSAIQKAIGPAPHKRTFRCRTCKSGRFLLSSLPSLVSLISQILIKYLIFQVRSAHYAVGNLLCFVIHVWSPRELRIVPGNLCNKCGHSIFLSHQKYLLGVPNHCLFALLLFRCLKIARGLTSSAKGYKSASPGAKSASVGRLTRK